MFFYQIRRACSRLGTAPIARTSVVANSAKTPGADRVRADRVWPVGSRRLSPGESRRIQSRN